MENVTTQSPLLTCQDIKKAFGATQALAGVTLEIGRAEVLCLIGENGAGKSTLMKILSGAITPDSGTITFDGEIFRPTNPHHARCSGISMVYQELSLAPDLDIPSNLLLGIEPNRAGWMDRALMQRKTQEILDLLGLEGLPMDQPVRDLSPAQKQMLEIGRSLLWEPRVLVLDEPTSSLSEKEISKLFEVIHRIRKKGIALIYISHFLEECMQIGDRYLVLRDGESVASGSLENVSHTGLIEAMVGRDVGEIYPQVPHTPGKSILLLKGLRGENKPVDVDLELREGEILGIAGLIGAGRTETLRVLFGLDKCHGGCVHYQGVSLTRSWSGSGQVSRGFGFLSENRKDEGLMLDQSIRDNALLSSWNRFARWGGWIDSGHSAGVARENIEKLQTRYSGLDQKTSDLSGGNQQKIALARLLAQNAQVFLLDEPTRGIDIKSKIEIYRLIGQLAESGRSVIIVSSYLPELLGICDRIAVMSRGRLVACKDHSHWTAHSIMETAVSA